MRSLTSALVLALALAACTKDEETDTVDTTDTDTVDTTDTADTDTADTDTVDTGPFECVEDAQEPNDDQTSAKATTGGTDLAVCGAADWWEIAVPEANRLDLTIAFVDEIGDLDLALYDADGAEIDDSAGTSNTEAITWINDTGDAAYVYAEVFGYSGAQNSYDLTVSLTPPTPESCTDGEDSDFDGYTDCEDYDCATDAVCECPPEDDYEPNDDVAGAQNGPESTTGLAVFEQDPDYFTYVVPEGYRIVARAPYDEARGDIDLDLFDASETYWEYGDGSNPNVVFWDNDSGAAVDMYLAVSTYWSDCVAYDLEVTVGPIPPETCDNQVDDDLDGDYDCDDDECTAHAWCACPTEDDGLEDADTFAAAVAGPTTGTFALFADDDDYYAYNVPAGATIEIALAHNLGDIDLTLFDAAEDDLEWSYDSDFDEAITWTNDGTDAVDVVLWVEMWSGQCATYKLDVNVTI